MIFKSIVIRESVHDVDRPAFLKRDSYIQHIQIDNVVVCACITSSPPSCSISSEFSTFSYRSDSSAPGYTYFMSTLIFHYDLGSC